MLDLICPHVRPIVRQTGETPLPVADAHSTMVVTTERDEMTWYKCEACGLMFDDQSDARQHEENCDAEEPSYIQ